MFTAHQCIAFSIRPRLIHKRMYACIYIGKGIYYIHVYWVLLLRRTDC